MSDTLKLKYKVGEIEFEAEGPADAVEQQRINFMNAVLPAAVNAMVQTRSVSENKHTSKQRHSSRSLKQGIQKRDRCLMPLTIPESAFLLF